MRRRRIRGMDAAFALLACCRQIRDLEIPDLVWWGLVYHDHRVCLIGLRIKGSNTSIGEIEIKEKAVYSKLGSTRKSLRGSLEPFALTTPFRQQTKS